MQLVFEILENLLYDLRAIPEKRPRRGRRQAIYFSIGGWCGKFSNYMGHWCPTKSNWVVGISLRGRGRKNINCPKKREVLSNLAKRKRGAKQTASKTAIFVYTQSSKLGCFHRRLVKNGTQMNSPIVTSVAVITSLGKHVFSEEFIQGNNAIG